MKITANDPEILSLIKITDTKGNIIPFEYNVFPDGQVQTKIPKYALKAESDYCEEINVKVSITNPIILDLLMQLIYSFPVNLTVNYLYGARCDKEESGDYFVANVARKMISEIDDYTTGTVYLAPHCTPLIHSKNTCVYKIPDCVNLSDYDCVVFPDESAYKRYADQLNGMKYVICEKHRDQESSKIISHKIPNLPDYVKKVILLDDLGDGLATFVNISQTIPSYVIADLFIFHGVFSNNALPRGLEFFNKIIVSNSLPNPQKQYDNLNDENKNRVLIFDVW